MQRIRCEPTQAVDLQRIAGFEDKCLVLEQYYILNCGAPKRADRFILRDCIGEGNV